MAETSHALGDVALVTDRCGQWGLCPTCYEKTRARPDDGCGRRYVAFRVKGVADEVPDGIEHLDGLDCPFAAQIERCEGLKDA